MVDTPIDNSGSVANTGSVNTTGNVSTTSWFDSFEPEVKGHIQNRGWDKLDPAAAAQAAVKSYREAEAKLGIPQDRVLKFPKDVDDVESWKALYTRLGVPDDKADYKLGELKFGAGETLNESFVNLMQDTASSAKLTPQQATAVTTAFMKFLDESDAAEETSVRNAAIQEGERLKASWGQNFDINNLIVNRVAGQMGIESEVLKTFSGVVGGEKVMEALLKIGKASGEARFITDGGNPNQILSADQAHARRAELMREISADPTKARNYSTGVGPERKEMNDLLQIIVRANNAQQATR